MEKTIIALIYDFDKTLSTKDMQEYAFIPSIGMQSDEFWAECNQMSEQHDMDGILACMYNMIRRSRGKTVLTADCLREQGKNVGYFAGVEQWFDMINQYGDKAGVKIEHYILSSGLKKFIEGTSIAKYFHQIFASEFCYDEFGVPYWPSIALNYSSKTQYLSRINKGIYDVCDTETLNDNQKLQSRRVDYENMIYIGDGFTDIPCMKIVRMYGGHSIGVFSDKPDRAGKMMSDGRINFMAKADYRAGSELCQIVKNLIDMLASKNALKQLSLKQYERTKGNK